MGKELGINLVCTLVLAPIMAFGIFAVSWWGTAPPRPVPTEVAPQNHNTTGDPPETAAAKLTTSRPVSGRLLFLANCASCHGADGSGTGEMVLDRPARSFKQGGFSFGNTIESIDRVITSGIPGTPMPGFKATLDPRERLAVARYVQSLGPPLVEVDPDDTIMRVTDRPRVIRGELSPLGPDRPSHVRGLITGGTDGLSWEYRTDDVRLLAVRQGEFVKRRNWDGRSGDPIQPLGRLIRLVDDGAPGPSFYMNGKPVASHLSGTSVMGGTMAIRQRLGDTGIDVTETGLAASVGALAGYDRRFQVTNPGGNQLAINLNLSGSPEPIGTDGNGITWYRSSGPGGLVELTGLHNATLGQVGDVAVALPGNVEEPINIITLLAPEWTPVERRALLGEEPSA
ncbi:MAG: c-type cytochrome [Phycisphaerales bacterium]|nr:c-type cytochrome [Phycisphaerales bacterium]